MTERNRRHEIDRYHVDFNNILHCLRRKKEEKNSKRIANHCIEYHSRFKLFISFKLKIDFNQICILYPLLSRVLC